jgi:hypothetical protein
MNNCDCFGQRGIPKTHWKLSAGGMNAMKPMEAYQAAFYVP